MNGWKQNADFGLRAAVVCGLLCALTASGCAGDDEGAAGGGGGDLTVPFMPGDPIEADANTWTYVHFPGSKCRDGAETGLGININPDSDKLIFYFEGGGACFNTLTCSTNPRSWGESNLGTPGGLLSRTAEGNPFKDWNMVYVPYCSGDVFSGTKTTGGYEDEPQQGYINVTEYLKRVVPTFPNVDQVVLSGSSAGGFGVAFNWMRTQDAFGDIPVYVLDDSGPAFGAEYFSTCLAQHMGDLWGWQDSIHPACVDCDVAAGNVVQPMMEAAVDRENAQRFALLSHTEDSIIKLFFGFGLNDCSGLDGFLPPTYPTGKFPMGLAELRTESADYPDVKMWVKTGTSHTFLGGIEEHESEGVTLTEWIEQFYTDDPAWTNVFPPL